MSVWFKPHLRQATLRPHMTYTQKCGKIPLGLPTCGSHFEELITLPKLSCGKVSHELSSTMESSRLYMWQNLVECRSYPTTSSARICHLRTVGLASSNDQFSKFFTHYIGGIDIDVPVRCNGSKVHLFSGVHFKHIIYLFLSNLS